MRHFICKYGDAREVEEPFYLADGIEMSVFRVADTLNEQERRIASLEAEVAALKPYRDGYDFEKSSPPVGKIVLVQDCDSNFFSAKKPFDDCSFYLSWNVEENGWDFASGDGDWVRWYPEPPMPEVTE